MNEFGSVLTNSIEGVLGVLDFYGHMFPIGKKCDITLEIICLY